MSIKNELKNVETNSNKKKEIITTIFFCYDCGTDNVISQKSIIKCRECGGKVFCKKRTIKSLLLF